jgi:hypothetical protein
MSDDQTERRVLRPVTEVGALHGVTPGDPVTEVGAPAVPIEQDVVSDELVREAYAAYGRIERHPDEFLEDLVPVIRVVMADTKWALAKTQAELNSNTLINADGTYDLSNPLFVKNYRERMQEQGRPWATTGFSKSTKYARQVLHHMRKIGFALDAVLDWYEELDDEIRDQWRHPITVWRNYEAYLEKQAKQQAVEPEPEPTPKQNVLAERIDNLVNSDDDLPEVISLRLRFAVVHGFVQGLYEFVNGGNTVLEPGMITQLRQVWADINSDTPETEPKQTDTDEHISHRVEEQSAEQPRKQTKKAKRAKKAKRTKSKLTTKRH